MKDVDVSSLIIPYSLFIKKSCSFRHSFQRLLHTPAAGIRNTSSGALTNVGTNGYAWSSSSAASGSVYAGTMNFTASNVNPLNTDTYRGHARAVRCVQASAWSCF